MKRLFVIVLALLLLSGCGGQKKEEQERPYMNISAEDAKHLMDTERDYVILDVRTRQEYEQGHIPGAILLPLDQVEAEAAEELPEKDQLILVYCRSGNRSKQASEILEKLGYTRIREFGGINDWPYETE